MMDKILEEHNIGILEAYAFVPHERVQRSVVALPVLGIPHLHMAHAFFIMNPANWHGPGFVILTVSCRQQEQRAGQVNANFACTYFITTEAGYLARHVSSDQQTRHFHTSQRGMHQKISLSACAPTHFAIEYSHMHILWGGFMATVHATAVFQDAIRSVPSGCMWAMV
jgi:hypothetical protein